TFSPATTGVYYFGHHDSCPTSAPNGIAFDDFSLQLSPSCIAPTALTTNSTTSTGATISWTASPSSPANGYIWEVVASGAGSGATPIVSGTTAAGVTTATISGLATNTPYDVYVRAVCSAIDSSTWAGPLSFTTTCSNAVLPLIEGFNSTTIPSCWSQQYVVGTSNLQYLAASPNPATVPQEGSDYVYWNSYNIANNQETRLVSPPITTTGTASVDISFYWDNDNNTNYNTGQYLAEGVTVQYSTNGTTWTNAQFFPRHDSTLAAGTSQWKQKLLTLPAGVGNQATVYIGFNFHSGYGDNSSFDNLHIYATPACAGSPSALTTVNTTSSTAIVSWTAASPVPAVGYNWEVVASGAGPTGTPIASGSTATDSAIISGLSPNTIYDVYVQSDCGGGSGTGIWAGPLSLSTPCVNTTLPLIQGFNNSTIPSCWSQQYVVGTDDLLYTTGAVNPTTTPQEGTHYVEWNSYGFGAGAETRLVSAPITTTGTASVDISFYYFNENSTNYNYPAEGMEVQYSLDGTTWTDVQFYARQDNSLPPGVGRWIKKNLTLPLGAGNQSTIYVGFKFHSEFGDNVGFDNLNIFPTLPCAGGPTNILASAGSTTTATVNWTAGSPAPANGYNWVVVASGDSATGTVIASGTTAAGVTTASISGLTANTPYDVYVQSNCGGGLGVGYWAGPGAFSTPCNAITTLPWTEGFEGMSTVGTDIMPPCWLSTPYGRWSSENAPIIFPPNINARGGTHYLLNRYNAHDTVYTPSFTLTGGTQYEFYFYYQTDGDNGWDTIAAMYGSSQSPSGMTYAIGTPVVGAANLNYIKYSAIFTPATSGDYFFGVQLVAGGNPNNIAFDDFGLQLVVPCPNPPLAGVIAGPSSVCPGTQTTLTLTGYSPFTTLQWQISSDSVNFTDIALANGDNVIDYPTQTTYYRVKVNCADSSYTPIFAIHMSSPTQCYCTAGLGGFCGGNNIDTAQILGTNFYVNYTTCNTTTNGDAYTVFPPVGDSTVTLQRGSAYTLALHMTGTSISSAWIDYDQNGTFDANSREWVQITIASNNGTAVLNVPPDAALGATGFRIRSRNFGNPNDSVDACTNFGSGETFDFIINIVDSNCAHTPTVVDTVTPVSCFGLSNGAIALSLSGGLPPFTHSWSSGGSAATISNLPAGSYTDTISFNNGCTYVFGPIAVTQPTVLAATIDSTTAVKCFGGNTGAVYVSVSGGTAGYSHHWSNGSTGTGLTGVAAGSYTDTITDSHGCTVILGPDTVTQPAAPISIALDSTHAAKCNGQNNGAVYITASGGTGPYTYLWSNTAHSTTDDVSGLPAGAYTVVVTDNNLCTASASDTVTQPGVLTIVTDSVINAKCHSSNDGSIYIHITGGTIPYTYAWTGGSTALDLFFKPAGAYTVSVTDHNGCSATATDTIHSPSAIAITSTIVNQIQNGTLGSITLNVSGGTGSYTYLWSNSATTSSLANLTAAVYRVTVTDQNGCTATQVDTVQLILGITDATGDITNFNIYPNPSSGVFNVVVELSHSVPVEMEVFSITGQSVEVSPKQSSSNNTYQLDLSAEADGVYFVKVKAGDNTMIRRITVVR
ncbi:MAG: hypothetical protein JWO03_2841, partial [Bacteroidetes bacterium]|nr:hypothetical protein [Bacteroidota bacterium]